MSVRELMRGFLPVLLSFASVHLILQTDLLVVARLGTLETAAWSVPQRLAVLDTVLLMALSAVSSVVVARARPAQRARVVRGVLTVALGVGVATALLGLMLYPWLARALVAEAAVGELAAAALLWFALAAPFRHLAAVALMALHALGEGPRIVRWKLAEVALNAGLDLLCVYALHAGFVGVFQSSGVVAALGCLWALQRLWRRLGPARAPRRAWLCGFLGQCRWELKRMASAQLSALAVMLLFANAGDPAQQLPRFAAYAAGTALGLLLFMPCLALLRFLAFRLGGLPGGQALAAVQSLRRALLPWTLAAAAALYLGGDWLGRTLYGLDGAWWSALVSLLALALPLRYLGALQRALLQAQRQFAAVTRVDAALSWGLGLPLVAAGLYLEQPWLTFAYLLLPELGVVLWLQCHIRRSRQAVPLPAC